MAKQKPKNKRENAFVFNDEKTKNSYGFKILTEGIGLKRFKKNPVMLDSHLNNNASVIGSWKEVLSENGLLTGVPVFDEEDKQAVHLKGKVDRGFIKACSMGILFDPEDFKIIDDELILTKSELMEVSVVAIPSNANSVRLYAMNETETPMSNKEVQSLCLSFENSETPPEPERKNNDTDMKITLTTAAAAALSLAAGQTEIESEALSQKIVDLSAGKKAAELQLTQIKNQQETEKLNAINTTVDNAVKVGKISAEQKDQFVELGIANEEILKSTLAAIPGKKSFSDIITNPEGGSDSEVKTKEDFQKLSTAEQMQFKAKNPAAYAKLFTKK